MNAVRRASFLALLTVLYFASSAAADVLINSGGPAITGYVADQYYTGGSAYTFGNQTGVYNTERWSTTSFSYAIPVTAGQIQVTLRLRESCAQCGYARTFRVDAEGQTALSNVSVPVNTVSDRTFTVTSDSTLNLVFTKISGEAWVNAVEVRQLGGGASPPVISFSASPSSVSSGGSATLTWSASNATSCTASGAWSGTKALSGSQSTGALSSTSTFTLTCTGAGGSASRSVTVTVNPAPTLSFTANPTSVSSGGSSTLTWSSTYATNCTASGAWSGTKALAGSQSTGPLSSTSTFNLSCSGSGGSVSRSVTVTVGSPAPTVSLTANPTTVTSGGSSTLSWTSSNATSCTASGGWSGSKSTSGSQSTGSLTSSTVYTLTCTGSGGSASDSASVTVTGSSGAVFPLHVESGKRYLVDASGDPFLVHGDSAWSLIVQLTQAEVDTYLENRRLKGFNTILVNLIEHEFANNPPRNAYGDAPFLTPGDFSTPNPAYFAHAEYVISKAAQKGILVLLTPAYMGTGGGSQGWYQEMVANGVAKLRAYGQYVANRFLPYDNIVWVHGGDYVPPNRDLMRAIVNGINDIDPSWLHTFHGSRGVAGLDLGASDPWVEVNNIYTDQHTVVTEAFQEYARSTMPFFLIEAVYENGGATPAMVRQQAYQAVLSGASGQIFGHAWVWHFMNGYWTWAIDSQGAQSMTHLRTLLDSRAWWTLQPDVSGVLLTAGTGSGASRAAASLAFDGSYGLVFTPTVRALTIDLRQFAGPRVQARWYDPTNGAYATIAGSPFNATSTQVFTPSGNNSLGAGDWVLVLESVP